MMPAGKFRSRQKRFGAASEERAQREQENLIEAGGRDYNPWIHIPLGFGKLVPNPNVNWGYETEPEPHLNGRRIMLPRGKVLGGSSTINAMLYSRGHPHDYDLWRQMGCEGWSYADLLPYFKRAETNWRGEGKYHGGSGPLQVSRIDTSRLLHEPVMEAAEARGYPIVDDHHGEVHEGFGPGDVTTDSRGRRSSASRAYLDPIRSRPNDSPSHASVAAMSLFGPPSSSDESMRGTTTNTRPSAASARSIVRTTNDLSLGSTTRVFTGCRPTGPSESVTRSRSP